MIIKLFLFLQSYSVLGFSFVIALPSLVKRQEIQRFVTREKWDCEKKKETGDKQKKEISDTEIID